MLEKLTHTMPGYIDLSDLPAVADHYGVEMRRERLIFAPPLEEVPDEDEDEVGHAKWSTAYLVDALADRGLTAEGSTLPGELIADDHWTEHIRSVFEDAADVSSVASYVDWDRLASEAKVDYSRVEVTAGAFEGVWWVRNSA